MSINLFVITALFSIIVTPIVILLIPRERHSPGFDRLLWAATPVVAFLCGWYAFGMADPDHPLGGVLFMGIPVLMVAIGVLVGAMAVNLPLWILDRFEHPGIDQEQWEWEDELEEESEQELNPGETNTESPPEHEADEPPPHEQPEKHQ